LPRYKNAILDEGWRANLEWNIVELWRLCRQGRFADLSGYPLKGARGNEAQGQKIPSSKDSGILPILTVSVRALERDIEHGASFGILPPDTRVYRTMSDFMNRPCAGLF
jgi:hypothetical protein